MKMIFPISFSFAFCLQITLLAEPALKPSKLEPPQGYRYAQALGVNNDGTIVGVAMRGPRSENGIAVVWTEKEKYGVRKLPSLPGFTNTRASGINNLGEIVGVCSLQVEKGKYTTKREFATVWTEKGAEKLAPLPGYNSSSAFAISDHGTIVGYSWIKDRGNYCATLWIDRKPTKLPPLKGFDISMAFAVNDLGNAVGYSLWYDDDGGAPRATIWKDGKPSELNSLHRHYSEALDINDSDEVVGTIDHSLPVVWKEEKVIKLDVYSWEGYVDARAINNSGQVVGSSFLNKDVGTLWQGLKKTKLLPPAGYESSEGLQLNDSGIVVGYALKRSFYYKESNAVYWKIEN